MPTRIVLIHPGPSDTCPCDLCRNDGSDSTPSVHDCDGTCDRADCEGGGGAIGGLCVVLAFLLILGIVLVLVGSKS